MSMAAKIKADEKAAQTKGKAAAAPRSELVETIRLVVSALLIAFIVRTLIFQPFTIPSESMRPTLLVHDYVIVNKFSYGYSKHSILFSPPLFEGRILKRTPKRGDVIVFKNPLDDNKDYIKRLIGLPGDTIQMREGRLYLNGQLVASEELPPEEIIQQNGTPVMAYRSRETLDNGKSYITYSFGDDQQLDTTGVYTVPEGHYFMMGDNRDDSQDSRVLSLVGYVAEENIIGRANFVLMSWDDGLRLANPISWFTEFRLNRTAKPVK